MMVITDDGVDLFYIARYWDVDVAHKRVGTRRAPSDTVESD
jgi:hypothetical protein